MLFDFSGRTAAKGFDGDGLCLSLQFDGGGWWSAFVGWRVLRNKSAAGIHNFDLIIIIKVKSELNHILLKL